MCANASVEASSVVKELAEAVSIQAKVANQTWLATITVSVLLLLPSTAGASAGPVSVQLPFGLGAVPPTVFYPLAFGMLTSLVVSLSAAHAQHLRANKLANGTIERLAPAWTAESGHPHPRDLFDILRESSLTRVAPLAQWIRGPYQFAEREAECPGWLRMASAAFYVALKVLAMTVLFLVPGLALWYGYQQSSSVPIGNLPRGLLMAAGVVAAVSLLVVAIADLLYVRDVVLRLSRSNAKAQAHIPGPPPTAAIEGQ